jgi:hypothetical protein
MSRLTGAAQGDLAVSYSLSLGGEGLGGAKISVAACFQTPTEAASAGASLNVSLNIQTERGIHAESSRIPLTYRSAGRVATGIGNADSPG